MEDATNTNQPNWKTTDNRFVAFLDILGFKDMVMRKDHDHIYSLLNNLSNVRNTIERLAGDGNTNVSNIYSASFSDSIIFFSKNDSKESFTAICASTSWLIAKAIEDGILVKGGLAHGLVSVNKTNQIYFGQPIIDAYLIEEDVNFLGAVAHCSIDNYLYENNDAANLLVFEEKSFLKSGYILHNNVNWLKAIHGFSNLNTIEKKHRKITANLEKLRVGVSGSARKYIENTIDFLNKVKENHPSVFD